MDTNEIAQKIRNKQGNYEELLKWCEEHIDKIDLNDKNQQFLYDYAMKFMMQSRINHLDEKEATIMIKYLSQSYMHEKGLDGRVKISVLDKEQFSKKYRSDEKLNAMCRELKGTQFELDYSPNVLQLVRSGNIHKFLDGLRIIYHETAHVIQKSSIELSEINGKKVSYTESMFEIALENVAEVADKQFYQANYSNLVLENQANKVGLIKGYLAIKKYAPQHLKQYSEDKIMAQVNRYDEQSKSDVKVFGKSKDRATQLDNICYGYITANNHLEVLKKYPILQLAYNPDGSKKDIITLLSEREERLGNGEDAKSINDLYRYIANQKNFYIGGLTGIKPEILDLGRYIKETGTEDEFVYDLLRDRLQMKNLTPENIESLIQQQKKIAESRRKQLQAEKGNAQQEIQYEEQESIKDEVGDDFKTKTQEQEQNEQEAETKWMNSLQSCDEQVQKMQDGAKRKQEVVKLIQNIEQEKRQEKREQIQEENQNNEQGR